MKSEEPKEVDEPKETLEPKRRGEKVETVEGEEGEPTIIDDEVEEDDEK